MPRPYGLGVVIENDDSVKVVGHDDVFVKRNLWEMFWQREPAFFEEVAEWM